jgi:group II intron reverse transcriptase/maturase
MQKAEHILQAMYKLGKKGLPLTRVYRCLYSEDLFLTAYAKIARNEGALTPGTGNDTADGMSRQRIHNIIAKLRYERFRFYPVRRTRRPKKGGGFRPLGLPDFTDKLVQEVLRLVLEAYYEPRFLNNSHGFRPGRGCHTALKDIKHCFTGTTWFIEGDIRGCFDHIDHETLLAILARDIHDGRLLNLIRQYLEAGYMEDWQYNRTYSGVPQGGVLSPLLANIYLHELDTFVEKVLIPQYTRGNRRRLNPPHRKLGERIKKAHELGDKELARELEKQRRQLPSRDPRDPGFRRLRYCRYADDFVLGFIGPKPEAEAVKEALRTFLEDELHLEMSYDKTLITHARTKHARFLGYAISVYHANDKLTRRKASVKVRSINGRVRLGIPYARIDEWARRYQRKGKPIHETGLLNASDAQIITAYQQRFRGLAQYYKYAVDREQLGKLQYAMEMALVKTLAYKHRVSVQRIYRRYRSTRMVNGHVYKTLQVEVPTKKGIRRIYWGAIPLRVVKWDTEPIKDDKRHLNWIYSTHSDLIQRLQADECELCGAQENCQVHHIRKLADLKKRWQGRKEKPPWVKRMIALRRKTMVVCQQCHVNIHAGRPVPSRY